MNLVFIGHVDHGKSTLIGRLLVDLGIFKEKDLKDEAGSFKFAWVMDSEKEERARGVTIDIAYQKIETQKNAITIIDAPGHRDFVKNMITGASQADAAVLVVAADDGVMPQTREHAALAFTLGVSQLVVAINKMDIVGFKEEVYSEVKHNMVTLLNGIGYRNVNEIPFIPVAAFFGDDVTKPSQNMPWYKGLTLLGALDKLKETEKPVNKPLRIPIQDVFSITGVGTVPIGKVETGTIRVKDIVTFEPSGSGGEVRTIEMHHEQIQQATAGDNIGFSVRGVSKDEVKRGDVAGLQSKPPTVTTEFTGKIVVLAIPTEISPGFTPLFHCHSAHVPGTITEILEKIDPRTGAATEKNPSALRKGDAGVIKVMLSKPMVIERTSDIPELSRFAIRHAGQTVAAGMCIDLVDHKRNEAK